MIFIMKVIFFDSALIGKGCEANSKHFVKDNLGLDIIIKQSVCTKVCTNQKPENLALSLSKSDGLVSFH